MAQWNGLRPRENTGGEVSQAPASFLSEASKRPLEASFVGVRSEVVTLTQPPIL